MSDSTQVIRFDWFIKKMLRDKSDYKVLEGFLSALLKKDIKVLRLLESEGNQEGDHLKYNRVDLLAEEEEGEKIIVEIQNNRESDYLERVLYGTSKVIVDYLSLSAEYKSIAKVISVSILYFNLGTGKDYIYYGTTEFYGMNTKEKLEVKYRVESSYQLKPNIFPEYYIINVERFGERVEQDIDEWIYMLKNSAIKKEFKSKYIKEAEEKMNLYNLSPEERKDYERYVTNVVIERDIMSTAREEGIEKGIEKGREVERMANAKEMLAHGESVDRIMKYLKISKKQIEELREKINKEGEDATKT